jgi:hypothetical protein
LGGDSTLGGAFVSSATVGVSCGAFGSGATTVVVGATGSVFGAANAGAIPPVIAVRR